MRTARRGLIRSETPDPAAWGLPEFLFEPLSGGARNIVLRGTGPIGEGYVFKSTQRSEGQLAWLSHLRAPLQAAGLMACLPRQTLSGAMADDGWIAEDYVPGRAVSEADLPRLRAQVAKLHSLSQSLPQRPGFSSARNLIGAGRGGDIDLSEMPSDLVAACRAAWDALPPGPLCAVHADLNPSNLAVSASGAFILYDWDEARLDLALFDRLALGMTDDPVAKRAGLAYEIANCWQREPQRARDLAKDFMKDTSI
jgi:hypothetical protein